MTADKTILIAGTYDTEDDELSYLADCIMGQGGGVLTMDVSVLGDPSAPTDLSKHDVAAEGGHTIQEAIDGGDENLAMQIMAKGAAALALRMGAVMLDSTVVNKAAAAVLAAPVAISLARGMDASVDPFLMAVAIGASCAFLTPIGHQSNTLVMAPGGYRFGDYWRLGLPLSILVVLCAVPAILWIWPL